MKINYILVVTSVAFWAIFTSCSEESVEHLQADKLVIEGFLYAGQPVERIRIEPVIPFGAVASDLEPLTGLDVTIQSGGKAYLLKAETDTGGAYYFYEGNDLTIDVGKSYALRLVYQEKIVSAETTVPEPPQDLVLSDSLIEIAQVVFNGGFPSGLNENRDLEPIAVTWDNPLGNYYYVVVENVEDNPESILIDLPFERNFRFVSQPIEGDTYLIQPFSLEQYGTHQIILYSVNQEYVDLYQTANQDSRDLNEPLTNVQNGLGVFTAFSSDTVWLEVVKR